MAWKESCALEERFRFVEAWRANEMSFAELCRSFSVSRKTGYKWVERYSQEGVEGLRERSRAPLRRPQEVLEEVAEAVIQARRAHPTWGPIKLRVLLEREAPEIVWPAASTIGEILKREGLTAPRRRRPKAKPNAAPLAHAVKPNDVWSSDFKGWFRTQDGQRCDPLTMSDAVSRFLLLCEAVVRPDYEHVQPLYELTFREHGLPLAMRNDNGPPFASTALGGLSRLGVWLVRISVRPERIRPGRPQENGRHERLHRTLKQETARPAKANLREQQRAFDQFRQEYNEQRPHAALGQQTPASCYTASERNYPRRIREPEYPGDYEVRRVKADGDIKWRGEKPYLSQNLAGEWIGLEPVEDGLWRLWFYDYELGLLDDHTGKVIGSRMGLRGGDGEEETDNPLRVEVHPGPPSAVEQDGRANEPSRRM